MTQISPVYMIADLNKIAIMMNMRTIMEAVARNPPIFVKSVFVLKA